MRQLPAPWPNPVAHLIRTRPDAPVLYLCPATLHATAKRFLRGFPGLVTYAVKANDRAEVVANLDAAGLQCFDVASPAEMDAVRAINPLATLHYNNPVRSEAEIAAAIRYRVASWSVDETSELAKLDQVPRDREIAVRFALPVSGATYDFGSKFGATPDEAVALLQQVAGQGWTPALCFHPGTQCDDPQAWATYIEEAARIAERAGVRISRLNVGGGFASHREGAEPDLEAVFRTIGATTRRVFGRYAPDLICEPGRAMVAEAFTLATRVKSMRQNGRSVYLNDGLYGGLTDLRDAGLIRRVEVLAPSGQPRRGTPVPCTLFGPTCDSLDRLPDGMSLPKDMQPGDYVLFSGLGAYSIALSTRFNGYGVNDVVTVLSRSGQSDLAG
jgi:ornithine decarboxylase